MNKAAQGIFCLLLVLSLLLSPAGAAAQTPPPPERPVPVPAGELGALQPWPLAGWPGGSGPLPHALQAFSDPLVSVIVQFEGQPLGERVAERGPLAARDQRNYVAALRSRQADVLSR
ncbi:MAG TPA: hypothetical protein VFF68_09740, partial [Anaerolineaceae bacterium]|nr:hypothetical protein [Anaerolineaceae bacterium]